MSENNSTRKLSVEKFTKADGSEWIRVLLLKYGPPHPQLVPSFRDLHRVIQGIAECEDKKYPFPLKGRSYLVEFFRDCVNQPDFEKLAKKYKIPERDGDRIVSTNGAAIKVATQPDTGSDSPVDLMADDIHW